MDKGRLSAKIAALICLVVLGVGTLAMSSTNYRLDWFVPLSGGGEESSSAHYAANVTVGQTVIGSVSNGYLGYWAGAPGYSVYLPLVQRN